MRWIASVLACCAFVTAGVAVHEVARARDPGQPLKTVADWRSYATMGHRLGVVPEKAAVTLVVFNDYECPHSRALAQQLRALAVEFPTEVSVVYRAFPLGGDGHAAAAAAECADLRGKFAAFHEVITTVPLAMLSDPSNLNALAARSGIADTVAFAQCRTSPDILAGVNAEKAAGEVLGVTGTPGILVNEELYAGVPNDIERIVARTLVRARGDRY